MQKGDSVSGRPVCGAERAAAARSQRAAAAAAGELPGRGAAAEEEGRLDCAFDLFVEWY